MEKDDSPEDTAPAPRAKRRRKPPVLELKANEIGGAKTKPADEAPRVEAATESRAGSADAAREKSAVDWRDVASMPLVTAVAGAAAGAVLVFALMSWFGGAVRNDDGRMSELANQIAALAARTEALANRAASPANGSAALGERIDRLTAAVGETEKRLASMERPVPAPDLSGVTERTAAIESALKELRTTLAELKRTAEQSPAVDALTGRIGSLEQRIAALAEPRRQQQTAAADLAAEVSALNALAVAVRTGAPFAKELEAARARLGDRAAPLGALESRASEGLPTNAELAEKFSTLIPKLLRSQEPGGGVLSRLLTNATRLVEVRPVGEPAGADVGAVVARIEAKLARGDLDGVLGEVAGLPELAKATASAWIVSVAERRDAERAIRQLIDAALTGGMGRKSS